MVLTYMTYDIQGPIPLEHPRCDALWYLDWQYMSNYRQLIQTLLAVLEKDLI